MAGYVMPFERPVAELESKLESLRRLDRGDNPALHDEIQELAAEIVELRQELYENLTPWMRVQIARHPERPKTEDYLENLFTELVELHGDRAFGDDEAMFAGFGRFAGETRVALLGHRKGKTTKENVRRHFGSPQPEGFRKARRLMVLADRFGLPLVTFLDTPGAHPGLDAEERGQAWAIAEALAELSAVRVPVVVVGIGEGGSGGALAIGFGDRLIMLENAYYSISTPEAAASILYKDSNHAEEVATSLKLTAADLMGLGIADEIVGEPLGGAHHDPDLVYAGVGDAVSRALATLRPVPAASLVDSRYERLRKIGVVAGQ
jgi:acetyl-CoA carboxylase carboxyl transferase subunit alpha